MSTTSLLPAQIDEDEALGPPQSNAEIGADNPQTQDPAEAQEQLLSDEDQNTAVKIITSYRTGWAPDRLLRLATWMRNQMMYKGHQRIEWDSDGGVWFDLLDWYKSQKTGTSGDVASLERTSNNITQMFGDAFIGTMSRAVPPTVIEPENADILADTTTAKFAQGAISVIERMNDSEGMLRQEDTCLYLYGVYFRRTRVVIDGEFAGWEERPKYADVPSVLPDRYHCERCGKDTPRDADNAQGSNQATQKDQPENQASPQFRSGLSCNTCGTQLSSANFYPSEVITEEKQVGTNRIPRAMVKWTIHDPLEVDYDPQDVDLSSPILALDLEIDIGTARRMFPVFAEEIKEGETSSTTPNADYEKLQRNTSHSEGIAYTSDTYQQKPTYSQVWMQPDSYFRMGDLTKDVNGLTFPQRMLRAGPNGLKVSMIGKKVVRVEKASLKKDWSRCLLRERCGGYPPSIADNVVPYNIQLNDAMDIIYDFFETSTSGIILADGSQIDKREWAGKIMGNGEINFVRKAGSGQDRPLGDALFQFKPSMDQDIMKWPDMIISLAERISGVARQTFGAGTQEHVETFGGQKLQDDRSQEKLNVFYEKQKVEHAQGSQNAIEHLKQAFEDGLISELWEVEQANGAQFRNNYVDLNKMNGRIRVYPKADQGLPNSPEQQRAVNQMIVEQAGKNNVLALELMDSISNQEQMVASLCGEGYALPVADQRARTLLHINTLLTVPEEKCPIIVGQDAQGQATTSPDLPVKPEIGTDDWKTLKDTCKQFLRKNWDSVAGNPFGKSQVNKYYQLAEQLEVQEAVQDAQRKAKVTQAGAPGPDPAIEQAKQALLKDGADSAARLEIIGAIDPALALSHKSGGALPAVISANKELLDTSLKAATA